MRIAFASDAHLFQTFVEKYDAVRDFDLALKEIKRFRPEILVFAGDMFDFKKTQTAYLRHYESEGLMIKIRNILKNLKLPSFIMVKR